LTDIGSFDGSSQTLDEFFGLIRILDND